MRFFFYGTLLDEDVRTLVMRRRPSSYSVEPATLPGYRRVFMRGRVYPVVLPHARDCVAGVLARGLDRAAADRLAEFETEEYQPISCEALTLSGRLVRCWVFAASPSARSSATPWDLDTWRRRHKRDFLRRLRAGAHP